MSSRLFLPTGKPYPYPCNRREELLNRLYETRTLMPEARTMPLEQLEDYVQAQEEKQQQKHYNKLAPAKRTKPMSDREYEQAVGALKEYMKWKRQHEKVWRLRP